LCYEEEINIDLTLCRDQEPNYVITITIETSEQTTGRTAGLDGEAMHFNVL
jgi:hypothetical protein